MSITRAHSVKLKFTALACCDTINHTDLTTGVKVQPTPTLKARMIMKALHKAQSNK